MKVTKYGVVVLTEGPVRVEGWLIEREPSDPTEATNEELLLEVAINWAQKRFEAALRDAARQAFEKKLFAKPKRQTPLAQADGFSESTCCDAIDAERVD